MTAIQACPHGKVQFNCSVCYVEMAKELVSLRQELDATRKWGLGWQAEYDSLRWRNRFMKLFLQEIYWYWHNRPFQWAKHPVWRNIYERLKSFLSESEGEGEGGGMEE